MSTPRTKIKDTFNGDNKHLRSCIESLINLSDGGSLVPHGLGGHARDLLASSYHRIDQLERELNEARKNVEVKQSRIDLLTATASLRNQELTAAKSALEKANVSVSEVHNYLSRISSPDTRWEEPMMVRLRDALTAINEVLAPATKPVAVPTKFLKWSCGICGAPAERHEHIIQCNAVPAHFADTVTGIWGDHTDPKKESK